MKKGKTVVSEVLQIAVKRREAKSKREKKIYLFECGVPENSKEK